MRQQLKWLRNGAFCAICPVRGYSMFCPTPWVWCPTPYMKMAVLSLILIPLTLAYAIVRYRLMDVDIIFRRGYAYTLATLCVLAAFYAIVFSLGSLVQKNFRDVGNTGLIIVMLMATFLFQPIRDWIQERLDKHFYQDRYDYRRTLVEFARELSSETDMMAMLASVAERLIPTLVGPPRGLLPGRRSGVRARRKYRLVMTKGRIQEAPREPGFEFPQLGTAPAVPVLRAHPAPAGRGFAWAGRPRCGVPSRSSISLTICRAPCAGRTIAYMGVSRTADGDYLSSVDVELLVTLSRLRRHRHRERRALPLAAAQGGRERAAEGVQREHRRVDQRRHSGGGPRGPRGELEHADRAVERDLAREGAVGRRWPSCFPPTWPSSSSACAAKPASTTSTSSRCARTATAAMQRERQWARQTATATATAGHSARRR